MVLKFGQELDISIQYFITENRQCRSQACMIKVVEDYVLTILVADDQSKIILNLMNINFNRFYYRNKKVM